MKKEYCFAAVSIIFWSTLAVAAKLLLESLNNFQLLCISSLFAFATLLLFNIATGKIRMLIKYRIKDVLTIAAIGVPGTFLYYVFYYAGAENLLASQAFIINYMWPIMSVIFACIILKEKMTIRKGIAIAMSFLGVIIVSGLAHLNFNQDILIGTMLCLMGAVTYGLFTALNQKMNYDKCISMMINFFVAFILTAVIIIARKDSFIPTPVQLFGIAWNGIFTMAIANTTWILALEHGNTAKISNLAYITPFLSLLWSSIALKEALSIYSVIGLLVIVGGILIQLQENKKV